MGAVKEWGVTLEEIDGIVTARPSLRGMLFGYVNEYKLAQIWFSDQRFTELKKYDNHDRLHKGDISFHYRGFEISVESKGLQTNSVREVPGGYIGRFQCDASDRRPITLPNGESLETTCLLVGQFDLIAVGLFEFGKQWRFAFAKNKDLPRSAARKYTPEQRQYLLAGTMDITWPLKAPFELEPFRLLDEIVEEKESLLKM